MSGLICFAMAVEDGLAPVIGAAPFDVLARQLPRLIVKRLNGGRDRGIRYFPFIGPVDGRRRFLSVPDMLPVRKLREFAGQSDSGAALLHGRIEAQTLQARIYDAADTLVFDEPLPLDPLQPLAEQIGPQTGLLFDLPGLEIPTAQARPAVVPGRFVELATMPKQPLGERVTIVRVAGHDRYAQTIGTARPSYPIWPSCPSCPCSDTRIALP